MDPPADPSPTVVVVTWQGAHLLRPCLDSLRGQTLAHRVVVVDNDSTDGTDRLLTEEYPEVEVLTSRINSGFAGAVAWALQHVRTPLVALLNNDAVAEPGWLAALVEDLRTHPEAAAVSSLMLLAGTDPPVVNNAGVTVLGSGYGTDRGAGEDPADWSEPGEVFGFSGGAALLRRDVVQSVGGFPAPFFLYYEDTDTSWRLRRAGWTIRYQPAAVVHHRHAASTDIRSESFAFYNERNRLLMHVRCAGVSSWLALWGHFAVTTASLGVTRARGRAIPPEPVFRLRLRLRVLASALRMLPWAWRTRHAHHVS